MFLALGFLELILLGVFVVFMIIGTALDRSETSDSFKWWTFLAGFVGLFFLLPVGWTFAGIWESFKSLEFWQPLAIYLGIGLAYSILEFALAVRRAARRLGDKWQEFLNSKQHISAGKDSTYERVRDVLTNAARQKDANELVTNFTQTAARSRSSLVMIEKVDGLKIEPRVNRVELAESISVWTLFWPFYAISLIIGDLLTEIFRTIADFLANASQRAVKAIFADTFKIG